MGVKNKVSNEMILMGIAIAAIGLLMFLLNRIEVVVFDAEHYLKLSRTFIGENGRFDILNFEKGMEGVGATRGLSYALWLFCVDTVAKVLNIDITIVNLFVNFFMFWIVSFLIITVLIDYNASVNTSNLKGKAKSVGFKNKLKDANTVRGIQGSFGIVFLFSFIARYSFTSLLSDLPALCALGFGTYFFVKALTKSKFRLLYAFIVGAMLYTSYNIRTIYIFSGIIMIVIAIAFFIRDRDKELLICLLVAIAGMYVAAIPQILVNYNNFQVFSVKVFSGGSPEATDLFTKQLFWGVHMQRYDTSMDKNAFSGAGFRFDWSGTSAFLKGGYTYSVLGYIELIFSSPLAFLALYISHFLNLLSPYFREAYVSDLLCVKWPYLILMYTVCYTVCFDILNKFGTKEYTFKTLFADKMLFAYIFILPVLAIVPGAIEHRFGIPLFFIIFYYLYYKCSWKDIIDRIKNNPVGNIAIYGVLLMGMLNFWIDTLASGPVILPL